MYQKKFAVTRVVENDETILKFFMEDEKEAAKVFGTEIAKKNSKGVIICLLAWFDEKNHIKNNEREIFEVWK